jgi:hypothetical protein
MSPPWVEPGAGVVGTVDGVVDGALAVGSETAGGGREGILGSARPLSTPSSGGEVLGVGALEASGDCVLGVCL